MSIVSSEVTRKHGAPAWTTTRICNAPWLIVDVFVLMDEKASPHALHTSWPWCASWVDRGHHSAPRRGSTAARGKTPRSAIGREHTAVLLSQAVAACLGCLPIHEILGCHPNEVPPDLQGVPATDWNDSGTGDRQNPVSVGVDASLERVPATSEGVPGASASASHRTPLGAASPPTAPGEASAPVARDGAEATAGAASARGLSEEAGGAVGGGGGGGGGAGLKGSSADGTGTFAARGEELIEREVGGRGAGRGKGVADDLPKSGGAGSGGTVAGNARGGGRSADK